MTEHRHIQDGTGLHERAIACALSMTSRQESHCPTIDELAAEAEIDAIDLRRIFSDSDAVMIAAAEQALVRLVDACVKSVVKVDPDDAVAQFGALGEAYIDWASDYREHFLLISGNHLVNVAETPQLSRYLDSIRDLMQRLLERARDAGHLQEDEDIPLLVLTSRTFAYGLARMVVDGRMAEWFPGEPELPAAKRALHDFLRRIARGSQPSYRAAARGV